MMFQPNILDQLQSLDMAVATSECEIGRNLLRDDDFESRSGGSDNDNDNCQEGFSGDEHQQDPGTSQRPKRKRYHRHTQLQIQEMEGFFNEYQHPDDKQRKELGRKLGLEPLQVKFWFQNKRTQVKTQQERMENSQLRAENERLRADNIRFKEALSNASCPSCGGPTTVGEMSFDEHNLRVENARLREEIDRISGIAAKYVGKPALSSTIPLQLQNTSPTPLRSIELGNFNPATGIVGDIYGPIGFLRSVGGPTEVDKPMIIELAVAAMEELIQMARIGSSLWVPSVDTNSILLNEEEYLRIFGPRPAGIKFEASRETHIFIVNHERLVEILMDVGLWSTIFSGIVSRAMTLEVLSSGVAGNYDGALQVMTAEFQVPTPLVPTREFYFVRYCKQLAENTWAVADVSLDTLHPNPVVRSRRRPSGCVIQEMQNGYSKVTWVEHVEVDDRGIHSLYKPLVDALIAFGAKRWSATLDRQCERLASSMATNIPTNNGVITSQEGRRNMMKLAERMVISFCAGVSASTAHAWTTLAGSGADDVRVMTRKSVDDPGRPPGIVLCTATSFWLPVPPKTVFEFLRDENCRTEWDILSNCGLVQEMTHIANGRDMGNCVSLLKVDNGNPTQGDMLILQESCTDVTASYVIYAPVDVVAMNMVLNGSGDPDYVALLPSGFAILPDGSTSAPGEVDSPGGSLLTVAFQILVDSVPTAKLSLGSVATVNNLITGTVARIKAAVGCRNA